MYMVSQEGQGDEDFAALLAESFGQENVKEGEILRGTVIAVGKDFAIVDAKVSEQSAVAHRALGEIELPEDTTIAAIARGAKLIVPGPATELLPGDDIIAIAHLNKEDDLRRLLV